MACNFVTFSVLLRIFFGGGLNFYIPGFQSLFESPCVTCSYQLLVTFSHTLYTTSSEHGWQSDVSNH